MQTRAASMDDLAAIADLQARFDTHWFGAPERDTEEMREVLEPGGPLAERSRLVIDDEGRLVAAYWYSGTDTSLLADPERSTTGWLDEALSWFRTAGRDVEVLSTDERLVAALDAGGWTHHHSSFELQRRTDDGWRPAAASWPAGIRIADLRDSDAEAVHRLIYVDAAWAEVPGHPDRDFESWRQIFLSDQERPNQQVLAWRDDRLVGVSMGRIFSDGAGWIAQLAVARTERGRGLGRALLLESLRRRIDAGATLVGLSVSAANRGAIRLYEDVGLVVDREWKKYAPPR